MLVAFPPRVGMASRVSATVCMPCGTQGQRPNTPRIPRDSRHAPMPALSNSPIKPISKSSTNCRSVGTISWMPPSKRLSRRLTAGRAALEVRPPGNGNLEHAALNAPATLSRQLTDDAGFQHWLKSNKLQSSGFATELRMPSLSRKAAIANISPTEHVPLIYGPTAISAAASTVATDRPGHQRQRQYQETSRLFPARPSCRKRP